MDQPVGMLGQAVIEKMKQKQLEREQKLKEWQEEVLISMWTGRPEPGVLSVCGNSSGKIHRTSAISRHYVRSLLSPRNVARIRRSSSTPRMKPTARRWRPSR